MADLLVVLYNSPMVLLLIVHSLTTYLMVIKLFKGLNATYLSQFMTVQFNICQSARNGTGIFLLLDKQLLYLFILNKQSKLFKQEICSGY